MYFLHGAARKISLPFLGLAAVGWIVFVVGFGGFNNDDTFYNDIRQGNHTFTPNKDLGVDTLTFVGSEKEIEEDFPVQRADPDFFPHWCYMISFPFLFATLILHLVFHSLFIFGVIGHFLLGLNIVCGAGAFWSTGSRLFSADNNFQNQFGEAPNGVDILPDDWLTQRYYGLWLVVEWVGVAFCLLMLVVFMMFFPLYTAPCSKTQVEEPVEDLELETKQPETKEPDSPLPAPQAAE